MYKKIFVLFKVGLLIALFFTSNKFAFATDINLTIRDESTIVFSGPVSIPTLITNLNDSSGDPHDVDPSSVLSAVASADQMSEDFEISEITYFSSFNSLYLKCISHASGEKCDNWQYVVDGSYPFSSMDQNILSGGENVYVYFGPQNKIILSDNSINTDEILTVTAQNYDYENNAWISRTGVTAGITQPNPEDPFNPIEITTSPVDTNGQTTFSAIPVGSYNIGIKEDFYFPTEALIVSEASPAPSSSGGGSNTTQTTTAVIKNIFDIKKAYDFLISQQKEDGSFGEEIYTDWTAVALAESAHLEQTLKLIRFLASSKTTGNMLTDYERHAIALMSLGLNPYNTNGENYIKKITDGFDGKQFGDINEDNDDIFALIVLQNAGFKNDEKMILDSLNFILSRQKENGSWDESVDMTGAGIQALSYFSENDKVKLSLEKAKEFLKKSQKEDGGWGNVSSTSWAIGGILALKENPSDWKKEDLKNKDVFNTPFDYLTLNQDTDGAMKNSSTDEDQKIRNKIWETAYTTVAYSGKTWNEIMQKFEKPIDVGVVLGASTEIKVSPKKVTAKPKVLVETKTDNTTPEINPSVEEPKPEQESKNWFMRFINFIF